MVVQVRMPRVQPRGVRVREYDGLSGLVGFTTAKAYIQPWRPSRAGSKSMISVDLLLQCPIPSLSEQS